MNPVIKNGSSFRGAGKYYLHDKAADRDLPRKLKPSSDERVLFTATRNCVHDDPALAFDEMWATAEAQNELKRANGTSLGGRRCTEPVKTIALTWHPSEQPTQGQMIAAADQYLAKMGWAEHQAVYVAHDDTAHAHIHIILNRVHPDTGRVLDDRNDFKRSQAWALDYEKEHGRIFCAKRLEYERDSKDQLRAANDNIPHDVIHLTRPYQELNERHEQLRREQDQAERAGLKADQRAEREGWFEDGSKLFKETRNAIWREVKKEYSEDWKQFYADKAAREEEAARASETAVGRALYFAKAGDWDQARDAFTNRDAVTDAVRREFAERAEALRLEQRGEVRERQDVACDALRLTRDAEYRELLDRQAAARSEMRELHGKGERAYHLVGAHEPAKANDVVSPVVPRPDIGGRDAVEAAAKEPIAASVAERDEVVPAIAAISLPEFPVPTQEDRDAERMRENIVSGAADLGAGMIGGVASYIADQLGELFAPTPPEVREAQARASERAKEASEQAKPANPYMRHIGEAEQKAHDERDREERERYWDDDRERRRER